MRNKKNKEKIKENSEVTEQSEGKCKRQENAKIRM